ncbi:MAG TPA: DNA-directed RNA polymerase subunit alpha [Anaerolineaceae bacterium]|jgi:DNA-directed RNA polymerase subunit alpha|nr:DNA-directed RNA polymerase subunit alpha [Anaerolineaceae bacterium]HNS07678.1 DNA-directed RNA polymerase subunit alpha [Anaerolineaceae bacterium]HOQ69789.1 DNA-directed RNA polymerase subunit alpha [Anaerolineaceae bacterium]HOS53895.1 DNA-directed RNA polymerase subunit alpha [Anaerolineaceae bacterium]HPD63549.1 DNA-directed RNA polymerase subunit alpha [Anaerolineaceae bacterium]
MCALINMVTPKIEREAEARNYGKFVIAPLERGFGDTLGNSLRRVLLSSLDGAAITSMRISDVTHEFVDIPGVREDVIQVILQIKQIRMILHEGDTSHLHLDVRGEGVVTAADLQVPAEVEIVNPELYLFTVDDAKTKLDFDFTVERGRGYSPATDRSGKLPIGELPVDAIYSPVKRVNFTVGSARVGQSTNYDRLNLEIWTDGTISPEKALASSSKVIIDHLRLISGVSEESILLGAEKEMTGSHLTSEAAETPIENLDLTVRVFNSLKRTGVRSVGDVLELLEKGEEAVMSIRNFGEKSLDELREKMKEKGYLPDEKELE